MQLKTRILFAILGILVLVPTALSQGKEYATWKATLEPADVRAGESARILVHVKLEDPWYLYGTKKYETAMAPLSTSINLGANKALESNGALVTPKSQTKIDKNFENLEVEFYEKEVVFALPVKVTEGTKGKQKAFVEYSYQVCKKGLCDIPRMGKALTVEFVVAEGDPREPRLAAMTQVPNQPAQVDHVPSGASSGKSPSPADSGQTKPEDLSMGAYLLFCFGAGLADRKSVV